MGGKPGENFPEGDQPSGGESWGDRFKRWKERGKDAAGRGKNWWKKKGKPGLQRAAEGVRDAGEDAKELAEVGKKGLRQFDKTQRYFETEENRRKFDVGFNQARERPEEASAIVREANGKLKEGLAALAEIQKTKLRFSEAFIKETIDDLEDVLEEVKELTEGTLKGLIDKMDQGGVGGWLARRALDKEKIPAYQALRQDLESFKRTLEEVRGALWALKDPALPEEKPSNNKILNPFLKLRSAERTLEKARRVLYDIKTVGGLWK